MTKRLTPSVSASARTATRTALDEPFRPKQPPRVPSEALLGEHGELIIVHAGRDYRLRRTSLGKLMLTA